MDILDSWHNPHFDSLAWGWVDEEGQVEVFEITCHCGQDSEYKTLFDVKEEWQKLLPLLKDAEMVVPPVFLFDPPVCFLQKAMVLGKLQ